MNILYVGACVRRLARVVLLSARLYPCNYVGLGADRSCKPAGVDVYSCAMAVMHGGTTERLEAEIL